MKILSPAKSQTHVLKKELQYTSIPSVFSPAWLLYQNVTYSHRSSAKLFLPGMMTLLCISPDVRKTICFHIQAGQKGGICLSFVFLTHFLDCTIKGEKLLLIMNLNCYCCLIRKILDIQLIVTLWNGDLTAWTKDGLTCMFPSCLPGYACRGGGASKQAVWQ